LKVIKDFNKTVNVHKYTKFTEKRGSYKFIGILSNISIVATIRIVHHLIIGQEDECGVSGRGVGIILMCYELAH
jgi:hypothetical protein